MSELIDKLHAMANTGIAPRYRRAATEATARIAELEAERDRLQEALVNAVWDREQNKQLIAERDRLTAAIRDGLQKMRTYAGIYDGDKELTRLLAEWAALSPSPSGE